MPLAREKAATLAIQRGMALYVKDEYVWGVRTYGAPIPICVSRPLTTMWNRAVSVLETFPVGKKWRYQITFSSGVSIHANSLCMIVWLYLRHVL